jgi:hypothetical protein
MSQEPATEAIHAGYGRIFRHPNGIIYVYMADDLSVNVEDAKQLVCNVRKLDSSGQARLLIIQGIRNDLTFEAQHYLGKVHGATHLALVVCSRLQAEVAQFFVSLLQIFHAPYEMRVFHLLQQAEEWLLSVNP